MKVFTEEWFKALQEAVKKDKELQNEGRFFTKTLQLKILKDPAVGLDKDVAFGGVPTGEPSWYGSKPDEEVDFIISGKAGAFVAVATGEEHPTIALGKGGSLELEKGSPEDLLPNMKTLMCLFEVMKSVSGL